ncbi:hypothetical protein [Bradyrhizobium sp. 131]|uniref:hypothetical protein n=1 Tax=Bradyrhizobium sp. 131 TaxID=2782609 RepID=UPI001FFE3EF2|nr:hypothetical protein [Bradyrhizobium sp. 131]
MHGRLHIGTPGRLRRNPHLEARASVFHPVEIGETFQHRPDVNVTAWLIDLDPRVADGRRGTCRLHVPDQGRDTAVSFFVLQKWENPPSVNRRAPCALIDSGWLLFVLEEKLLQGMSLHAQPVGRLPTPPHFPNRVAASGEYRFEFAFIRSHSRDAFQNVSTHGFVVPAAGLQVIASVLGSVKTHLPVLCGLAGGRARTVPSYST